MVHVIHGFVLNAAKNSWFLYPPGALTASLPLLTFNVWDYCDLFLSFWLSAWVPKWQQICWEFPHLWWHITMGKAKEKIQAFRIWSSHLQGLLTDHNSSLKAVPFEFLGIGDLDHGVCRLVGFWREKWQAIFLDFFTPGIPKPTSFE